MSLYYQDDHVTLYHGDCLTDHTEWLDADVLVTDPPYGIAWAGIGGYIDGIRHGTEDAAIIGDKTTQIRDEALTLWGAKPSIVFGSWRASRPPQIEHRLIWHKKGQAPGPANMPFLSQDEEIYISGRGFKPSSPPMRSVIATNESRSRQVQEIGHPTPKPVGLMSLLIEKCPPGIIADPFAGSGSTLIAAKALGRNVIGVEVDEKYCEIVANRCAQDAFKFGEAS